MGSDSREAAEYKAAEPGAVEILMEQLAKSLPSLLRGEDSQLHLELGCKIVGNNLAYGTFGTRVESPISTAALAAARARSSAATYPIRTASIEIDPPSTPATGKLTLSPFCWAART